MKASSLTDSQNECFAESNTRETSRYFKVFNLNYCSPVHLVNEVFLLADILMTELCLFYH